MQSDELEGWRRQIDRVDSELMALLARRKRISEKIMHWKKRHDYPLLDDCREQDLLDRLSKMAEHLDLDPKWIKELYGLILKNSKTL